MTELAPLTEYAEYIRWVATHKAPQINNMPVCPYAKRNVEKGRVMFEVFELTHDALFDRVKKLLASDDLDLITCIEPTKDRLSHDDVVELAGEVNKEFLRSSLVHGVSLHPDDPFELDGLFTRRAPHPTVQLMKWEVGTETHEKLLPTGYYKHWTEEHDRMTFPGLTLDEVPS